jgi:hypothetical protein
VPTTLGGLVVFVLLLVPGFVHYIQRRQAVPQRSLSPLVETATLATVSLATIAVAAAVFGLARTFLPDHSPDIRRLLVDGMEYAAPRVGYLLVWAGALLLFSSTLALLLAMRLGPLGSLSTRFAPAIVDVSAWYHEFEEGPPGTFVYLGCDLRDGSYMGGILEWYSTAVEETADRDLALASPITFQPPSEGEEPQAEDLEGVSRVIVSARDVVRIYVSYINEGWAPAAANEDPSPTQASDPKSDSRSS